MNGEAPLDPRELFSRPWAGPVTVVRPRWLRWLPVASSFQFHTEISDVDAAETTGLVVHDTTTFPNGRTWERTMIARLIAPGQWKVSARDMPGGAEQRFSSDGFQFTPYTVLAPVFGPIRLPLRCNDEIRLVGETSMVDTVEMRFLGVHVGTATIRLART